MLETIITTKEEDLLKEERQWLAELQAILSKLGASAEDQATLAKSIQQLDELFLLVIVGEFNAGKSAFINALLGQVLLKEGVTPTTAQVNILTYATESRQEVVDAHLHRLYEPMEFLRHINIVDTPGTNAIIREHQRITEEFVPRSDLVLFVTSADRPFSESERTFLSQIKDWGKKVVMVINKVDLFEDESELEQVLDFVADNSKKLLNTKPEIFPISARLALRAKQGDPAKWTKSGFEALESFIHDTLDETSRIQLKFLNPLGIGDNLVQKYTEITENRLELLVDDVETLANLEQQMVAYRQDMERDFKFRLADIDNVLYQMDKRGDAFFEDTMKLTNIVELLNKNRIQEGFENRVVADAPQAVEQRVNEMIDWLVNAELTNWQAIMKYLEKRKKEYEDRMVGDVGGNFRYDRDRLIGSVGRVAKEVVSTYNHSHEAERMAENARMAVAGTAAFGVGAIGLGAIITAIATTVAADVTGLFAAGAFAALGLFFIPARKKAAKKEMTEKVAELRQKLTSALTTQFEREIRQSFQRIEEAIGPYTRFVRSEKEKLEETRQALAEAASKQTRIRSKIEGLL